MKPGEAQIEQVMAWVDHRLRQGWAKKAIVQELVRNGWPEDDALQVVREVVAGNKAAGSAPAGALVSGLAFVLSGAAVVSLLAFAAFASWSTGSAALSLLIAAIAASATIALVGKFGVSPVWPILGFVTTIVLLLLLVGYTGEGCEVPCQHYRTNPDGSRECADLMF